MQPDFQELHLEDEEEKKEEAKDGKEEQKQLQELQQMQQLQHNMDRFNYRELVTLYNRRLLFRKYYILQKFEISLFDQPLLVMLHEHMTGRELYEEVWMKVKFMLELSS